ncbi:hypothetical protein AYP89_03205 [Lactobacillus crispatus]|nr:hypothetical protein AYP84_04265 [Lactobacillus crispatus]OXC32777.1 hypothetical protein AYP87_00800 [Lactobacillus crispatus]OXC37710.1 hypothetical protein AYP89_03205 [Lactobacillus crispatus]
MSLTSEGVSLGNNINLANFVPLEVLETGVIPKVVTTKLRTLQFVPHFRGSFSWLAIGKNINFAYCPARGPRGGSYSSKGKMVDKPFNDFVPIPRGVIP